MTFCCSFVAALALSGLGLSSGFLLFVLAALARAADADADAEADAVAMAARNCSRGSCRAVNTPGRCLSAAVAGRSVLFDAVRGVAAAGKRSGGGAFHRRLATALPGREEALPAAWRSERVVA